MEINNFVTKDFLASFTGTLFVVELMVFVTKNLPIIKNIRTRFYTFILSVSHIILVGLATKTATQTVIYYYSVFINSLIVTVMLCGGYDIIVGKVDSIINPDNKEINNSSDNDINTIVDGGNKNNKEEKNKVN